MKTSYTRIFAGLGIVLLGGLLLLNTLNIEGYSNLLSMWWPLFMIGAGVLVWLNDPKGSFLWGMMLIGFGVLFQINNLDVLTFNPLQLFWPVVVIVVGLSILFRRSHTRPRPTSENSTDDIAAILSGAEQVTTSTDYGGGRVTTIMGGATLDLRKAVIKKEATLDVFALMGGIELWVPENVVVKAKTTAILGGIENKSHAKEGKNVPVLYITGQVVMAGIEIKN